MKRMSEVFELPVQAVDIEWLTMQSSDDADEAIAHAINHVDALADALSACVDILGEMEAAEDVSDAERAYNQAFEALAAYRGGK